MLAKLMLNDFAVGPFVFDFTNSAFDANPSGGSEPTRFVASITVLPSIPCTVSSASATDPPGTASRTASASLTSPPPRPMRVTSCPAFSHRSASPPPTLPLPTTAIFMVPPLSASADRELSAVMSHVYAQALDQAVLDLVRAAGLDLELGVVVARVAADGHQREHAVALDADRVDTALDVLVGRVRLLEPAAVAVETLVAARHREPVDRLDDGLGMPEALEVLGEVGAAEVELPEGREHYLQVGVRGCHAMKLPLRDWRRLPRARRRRAASGRSRSGTRSRRPPPTA